ncbi:hypothetical protein [Roseateles depolymerans]|uniref:Uncharacterized protein n=1 Tax=Roseateles depolymerans TaxID=76731 RepID=A0A0U3MSN3_9BURK|nr:hypothetical protein [Roseateles depolymerans]ALV07386.1 hypothetical protein RD2015_2924 [Roseateles depolymerans]REG22402.1 hypothetical protein DES44_1551 [Roseateles depolymerans]
MIWLQLLAYFAAWTIALMAVLEVFAWLLRRVARLPRPLPLVLGLLLYGVVACTFALPLFGLELVQGPRAASSEEMRSVALMGYLVCLLLAVLFFRRRHLVALRALGYFQSRLRH